MQKKPLTMIDTRPLFGEVCGMLLSLLSRLEHGDWSAGTCYPEWKVRDIVVHLLQTTLGRLSGHRDSYPAGERPASPDFDTLAGIIDNMNNTWSNMFERISPPLVVDMLSVIVPQLADFMSSLDPADEAYYAVTWAGEKRSENWFDIAREYTEHWHHQQQIREAVGASSILVRKYGGPVIDTLIRAVPYWYAPVKARTGSRVLIDISGECGGKWVVEKESAGWSLFYYLSGDCDETVSLSDDTAWRLLTRSVSKDAGSEQVGFSSGSELCTRFLDVKAILIAD